MKNPFRYLKTSPEIIRLAVMMYVRFYHKDSSVIRLRPQYPNHIWSVDFVHDKLSHGRAYKMLTVLNEYTRQAMCVAVKPI